jgi:hypothetical protein
MAEISSPGRITATMLESKGAIIAERAAKLQEKLRNTRMPKVTRPQI